MKLIAINTIRRNNIVRAPNPHAKDAAGNPRPDRGDVKSVDVAPGEEFEIDNLAEVERLVKEGAARYAGEPSPPPAAASVTLMPQAQETIVDGPRSDQRPLTQRGRPRE